MPNTVAQLRALANSSVFVNKVVSAIHQKATAIVDDFRVNGNANYTAQQVALAKNICLGSQNVSAYIGPMSTSTNVNASVISYNFETGDVVSDISDAALQAQVYTIVFQDLVG